jgi:hypothetical protein
LIILGGQNSDNLLGRIGVIGTQNRHQILALPNLIPQLDANRKKVKKLDLDETNVI